jgi:ribonucleoside-diphosphate reductase alpha chain
MRERLPDTRRSVTHRVKIGAGKDAIKLFITVGLYENGNPGEVFLQVDEKGTTLSGFCICIGILMSLCLQNGVTLNKLHEKLSFQEFDPRGMTDNKDIHFARSVIDYAVQWINKEFGGKNNLK